MGPDRSIDWVRWLFYLLAGVPLVAMLFFVRDRVLRVVGVVFVTIFIQDSFVGRRYFWAFSLGASLFAVYVALMAQVLERRRLPDVGIYGPLWLGLLFSGGISIIAGSLGNDLLQVNVKAFQFCYLEGLVFFVFGIVALRKPDEVRGFFQWMVVIGALIALQHFFVAVTGFQFRGSAGSVTSDFYYGGVFDNGNSLGSYYVMGIPTALAVAFARRTSQQMKLISYGALVLMSGSLLLTGSRGGMIFTVSTCALLVFTTEARVGRLAMTVVLGAAFVAVGYFVISSFAATPTQEVFDMLKEEGLRTGRWTNFAAYAAMMIEHPFGSGMSPENMRIDAIGHGISMTSAHNIYLDIGTQTGIAGLLFFLAMIVSLMLRNRRAARIANDSASTEALGYLFLSMAGFLSVGFFEPILASSNKLNNLFFLFAGMCVGMANQAFDARRAALNEQVDSGAPGLRPHAPRI